MSSGLRAIPCDSICAHLRSRRSDCGLLGVRRGGESGLVLPHWLLIRVGIPAASDDFSQLELDRVPFGERSREELAKPSHQGILSERQAFQRAILRLIAEPFLPQPFGCGSQVTGLGRLQFPFEGSQLGLVSLF